MILALNAFTFIIILFIKILYIKISQSDLYYNKVYDLPLTNIMMSLNIMEYDWNIRIKLIVYSNTIIAL